ncbi:putative actin interacting protein 1 [Violaceomyces palustris]|uniref:Actin interacting protein 1 n=1 Tax=Violaceomyces palustris TaxID=1673888 RepID=A0ACD0P600_9BASI|nr:putative actin interacting protein 1 [Violaceomyces palustris]
MSASLISTFAANPTTIRAQSTKLSVDPKGERIVYTQARSVIVRSLNDPKASFTYSQHSQPATVARISPSGYYVASADVSGTVRVWDIAGTDQILKNEVKVIAGKINDLVWDGESKRIIAVGEGREKYGHAFTFDTGSSVGEIIGHSKPINAVAVRRDRPFRAVTASDDNSLIFYHGVPYKYNKTITAHTKFVQDVSYSPSGDHFVSVGSDSKVFLYDGKTGDLISDLSSKVSEGHVGTIFAVDFSPDSKRIVTAGADGTVKVWDVSAEKLVANFDFNGQNARQGGQKVEDQQVGVTFAGDSRVVSLSFSGDLNVIDLSNESVKQLYGACKSVGVGSLDLSPDGKSLVAGCFDGRILTWDVALGVCSPLENGGRHGSAVTGIASSKTDIISTGMDDSIRRIKDGGVDPTVIPTTGQPKASAVSQDGTVFVVVPNGIDIVPPGSTSKLHQSLSAGSSPSAIATDAQGRTVAVGYEAGKVEVFEWDGKAFKSVGKLENGRSIISALALDPHGGLLAAGESNGKILVYDLKTMSLKFSQWVFHTGRIHSIRFSPDGTQAVSGSLDTNIYIWSTAKPTKNIAIKNAHAGGVSSVCWLNNELIASAGADGCIRTVSV